MYWFGRKGRKEGLNPSPNLLPMKKFSGEKRKLGTKKKIESKENETIAAAVCVCREFGDEFRPNRQQPLTR